MYCWVVRIYSLAEDSVFVEAFIFKIPDQTGESVDCINRKSHGFADITDCTFVMLLRNSSDNRSTIASIFFVNVLHHFLASFVLEVNIDVRRLISCGGDETLK